MAGGLVLIFTGMKMLTNDWVHISAGASVLIIAIVLLTTIGASVLFGNSKSQLPHS